MSFEIAGVVLNELKICSGPSITELVGNLSTVILP